MVIRGTTGTKFYRLLPEKENTAWMAVWYLLLGFLRKKIPLEQKIWGIHVVCTVLLCLYRPKGKAG